VDSAVPASNESLVVSGVTGVTLRSLFQSVQPPRCGPRQLAATAPPMMLR